ncbi:hypothetical protein BpHYR1_052284 [Brachionus plicatilis]|uniref:Uncharacterized protein n=1 Tax=Brachionus plicatilis TaxID=10195 RepID=A0A3M7S363_BRAPC|nr:hypothetical protein BpHYR1_052284 [Brachionus plicatilis]
MSPLLNLFSSTSATNFRKNHKHLKFSSNYESKFVYPLFRKTSHLAKIKIKQRNIMLSLHFYSLSLKKN